MDTEIAVEWMGVVLKALIQWFKPPKDLSDLPDAEPIYHFTTGADNAAFGYTALNAAAIRPMAQPLYDYMTIPPADPGNLYFNATDNTLRITTTDGPPVTIYATGVLNDTL